MARYQLRDRFYRMAQEKGLPSRAAFKLDELLSRYRLLKQGGHALDLGCAPGGWLAILAQAVSPTGRVVGVDLVSCPAPSPLVTVLVGDLRDKAVRQAAMLALGAPADLVTSDMAPKLTGIRERDRAAMSELLEAAATAALESLRPGGAFIAKTFVGTEFTEETKRVLSLFGSVHMTRPRATRKGSSELYMVALNFRQSGSV